jgi:transposase
MLLARDRADTGKVAERIRQGSMIPAGVQVFVALEPVDKRFGFERLSGMVRERMGYEPRRSLFVFVGRRRQLAKILFADERQAKQTEATLRRLRPAESKRLVVAMQNDRALLREP